MLVSYVGVKRGNVEVEEEVREGDGNFSVYYCNLHAHHK